MHLVVSPSHQVSFVCDFVAIVFVSPGFQDIFWCAISGSWSWMAPLSLMSPSSLLSSLSAFFSSSFGPSSFVAHVVMSPGYQDSFAGLVIVALFASIKAIQEPKVATIFC